MSAIQQTHDRTRAQVAAIEHARSEGVESFAENLEPADAEAGGVHRAGKSPHPDLLRYWSDDDVEVLTHTGGAAPSRGGDDTVEPPRRLRKTADAWSSRAPAAPSRTHGKDDAAPKPAMKRVAEGPAARGKTVAKRGRQVVPTPPTSQAIPTAIKYASLLTSVCCQVALFLRFLGASQDATGLGIGGDGRCVRGWLLVPEDPEQRHRPARGLDRGGPWC